MAKKKKISVGISDFKELIENNYYYVDKSLFIEEILEDGAKVILLPRPRRFGKTLNLSMLNYFLEKTEVDHSGLFKKLAIAKNKELMKLQGQNPIIFMTFKDVKVSTWIECEAKLKSIISKEYKRLKYLIDSDILEESEKQTFQNIIDKKALSTDYEDSLKNLSEYLFKYHKERSYILMDEYDTPIQSGYLNNYKEDVIAFLRNFLSGGLKDNINLEKGILTGILRVSKENIFSGMNNLAVHSLIDNEYSDKFGLTPTEVKNIVSEIGCKDICMDEIQSWYNGYKFGDNTIVYNPWSIVNFLYKKCKFGSYWINSSDNALINKLIIHGGETFRDDIEKIISGKTVEKIIDDNIVFDNLDRDLDVVWSLLLFSGYLTYDKKELIGEDTSYSLKAPNREISSFLKKAIVLWFKEGVGKHSYDRIISSLIKGDIDTFTKEFQNILLSSMSYFDVGNRNLSRHSVATPDEPERVYHAFALGVLVALRNTHEVKSNKESGFGRYDVMIIPKDKNSLGIVIEFKIAKTKEKLEASARDALKQIESKHYIQELKDRGIEKKLLIGMAFRRKEMAVKSKFV